MYLRRWRFNVLPPSINESTSSSNLDPCRCNSSTDHSSSPSYRNSNKLSLQLRHSLHRALSASVPAANRIGVGSRYFLERNRQKPSSLRGPPYMNLYWEHIRSTGFSLNTGNFKLPGKSAAGPGVRMYDGVFPNNHVEVAA